LIVLLQILIDFELEKIKIVCCVSTPRLSIYNAKGLLDNMKKIKNMLETLIQPITPRIIIMKMKDICVHKGGVMILKRADIKKGRYIIWSLDITYQKSTKFMHAGPCHQEPKFSSLFMETDCLKTSNKLPFIQ
jgi:hypothetical protein